MGQRCERRDGSFYGTGGTCRKGTEAPYTAEETKQAYDRIKKERTVAIDKALKNVDSRLPSEMDAETRRLEKIGQGLLGFSGGEISKLNERYREIKKEVAKKLDEGNFSKKDLDEYLTKGAMEVNPTDIAVNIGMEYGLGLPPGLNKQNAGNEDNYPKYLSMVNRDLAGHIARTKLEEELPEEKKVLGQVLSWTPAKGDLPTSAYHANLYPVVSSLGGMKLVSKDATTSKASKVGEIELRPLPVNGTGTDKLGWPYPNLKWVKDDPELSKILSSRQSYYEYSDRVRSEAISKKLTENFTKNSLKTVVIATGKTNAEVTDGMISTFLKDNPKAVAHKFTYQVGTNSDKKAEGQIIDVDGRGEKFIYVTGVSVNAQGFSWSNAATGMLNKRDEILQERATKLTEKMS
jgi:hypothetical protein